MIVTFRAAHDLVYLRILGNSGNLVQTVSLGNAVQSNKAFITKRKRKKTMKVFETTAMTTIGVKQ